MTGEPLFTAEAIVILPTGLARLSQLGRRMSDFRVFCVEKASQYNER